MSDRFDAMRPQIDALLRIRDALKAERDAYAQQSQELHEKLLGYQGFEEARANLLAGYNQSLAENERLRAEVARADREHVTLMELADKKLAALRADNARWENVYDRLRAELRLAQPFHRDAIKARENERAQLTELREAVERYRHANIDDGEAEAHLDAVLAKVKP